MGGELASSVIIIVRLALVVKVLLANINFLLAVCSSRCYITEKDRVAVVERASQGQDFLTALSEEEASENCLGVLGSAKLVARQLYETHSQGTWGQRLLTRQEVSNAERSHYH